MKKINYFILFSLIFCLTISSSKAQTFNGYALYNLLNNNTTYLIDKDGNIAHSWSLSLAGSYAVQLKEDGNLLRSGVYGSNQMNGAAISGIIQEFDPSGNIVWQYVYSTSSHVSHHDITLMPNGNVMLIAWEVKTATELTQAGYDGASSDKWPTHFIEVQQNGTGGEIVWEWHMWDHMIQDYNASKDNYGVVADNPQLMDINAISSAGGPPGPGGSGGDWYHCNGIDYNPTLDQLVFSSRNASEIFIIDHSTTTAEAAGHTGGNAGMGGDFLFRWGNPSNYGSTATQNIPAAVHDPRWIKDGRPYAGYIQYFNNEAISSNQSAVEAINPPLSGYNYTAYGSPSSYDLRHVTMASSSGQSASDRMSNGNLFVSVSQQYMYEIDSTGSTVWQYNAGPAKAFRYECDYPGIVALLGNDPCGLATGVEELAENDVTVYPNPSQGVFKIKGIAANVGTFHVNVYDMYGKLVVSNTNNIVVNLSDYDNGIYIIHVEIEGKQTLIKKVSLMK
jgi:hypothetical protein